MKMDLTTANVYNITRYGAFGDGKTVCTAAIQKTIDECSEGGVVYVPAGIYVTGALFLKSDMTLYLEKDSVLLGSANTADYPVIKYRWEGRETDCYASLINTADAGGRLKNIVICGEGHIDANGSELKKLETEEGLGARGRTVCLRNVDDLRISGVTLKHSPAWCAHLIYCGGVVIDNVRVYTKHDENGRKYEGIVNGDGIDIDSCKNVLIKDCEIHSQDDCIAIKSGRDKEGRDVGIASENVRIINCIFKSGFGVAVGSEMSGGVRNITVSDCVFENTYSIASVKAPRGRGNVVENVVYENCTLENNSTEHSDCEWFRGGLYIDTFYSVIDRNMDVDKAEPFDETTPVFKNITLKNIKLKTVAGNAVYLSGLPEAPLENITLENITAHGKYGMKAYNIKGLTLKNVSVSADEGEERIIKNVYTN